MYPTAGAKAAQASDDPIPFLIPKELFEKVTEKIVRGIMHVETGRFVEPPLRVIFFPDGPDMDTSEFAQVLRAHGKTVERGPGTKINYATAVEDGMSGLFEIVFWGGQLRTYASISAD